MEKEVQKLRREIQQCPDCGTIEIGNLDSEAFSTEIWLGACDTHRRRLIDMAEPLFDDSDTDR